MVSSKIQIQSFFKTQNVFSDDDNKLAPGIMLNTLQYYLIYSSKRPYEAGILNTLSQWGASDAERLRQVTQVYTASKSQSALNLTICLQRDSSLWSASQVKTKANIIHDVLII